MIHALALAVTALVALQSLVVHAIPTISAVNAKFFTSEGRQWYVKGQFDRPQNSKISLTTRLLLKALPIN